MIVSQLDSMVDIELTNTYLENRNFENINIERSESDWIYCSISDNIFHGNGGSKNL